MTELNFVLRLSADGKSAKAEVAAVAGEVKKLGTETVATSGRVRDASGRFVTMGGAAREAGQAVNGLGNAAGGAAPKVDGLAAAERRAATNAVAVGKNHAIAAGSVGNLAAQFNDVAMMAIAGQAPLATAIQQGTQIGQVFGNAGAAGALRMVGAGIMQMLSPVNLITIAAIAAGAAFYQWLTSSETEVKSLDDAVSALEGTVKTLRDAAKVTASDLKKDFGEITPEIVRLNEELTALADAEAIFALRDAMSALKSEVSDVWGDFDVESLARACRVQLTP